MTLPEAQAALALAGPGFYIYHQGLGHYANYELRRCPPRKTPEQRAAMQRTRQHGRLQLINEIASREYADFYLRSEWHTRWRNWRKHQLHSKKNPDCTDDGHRISSLWAFMLAAIHWLYRTHTTDPLVPNRFSAPDQSPTIT